MTENLLQDFRASLRSLKANARRSILAVLTLAIGIGANTTVFSWISGTLLNPIPGAAHTESLVSITLGDSGDFSYPDYTDLAGENHTLSGLTAFTIRPVDITDGGKPERLWATLASNDYFDVLQVQPVLGRVFNSVETSHPGSAPVAVISYAFWQSHLGMAKDVLGKTIHLNQQPYTIVGVVPAAFRGSETGVKSDLWVPVTMQPQLVSGANRLQQRDDTWLMLLGKMKPEVTRHQVRADLGMLMQRLTQQYPSAHQNADPIEVYALWDSPNGVNGYFKPVLTMLMAVAGVVLLLSCVNVANLLLISVAARERDFVIRLAMGVNRSRMIRLVLLEGFILAMGGGFAALLLTLWSSRLFSLFMPPSQLPVSLTLGVNPAVFVVTLLIAGFTSILFGLLPALRSSGLNPMAAMKENTDNSTAGTRKTRLSNMLVVAQVALSVLLLTCAALFVRSFQQAQQSDVGFNQNHVLLASVDLFPAGYNSQSGVEFDRQLLLRLQALPGVQSATLANWVPLGLKSSSAEVSPGGYVPQAHESMEISEAIVGPEYLKTMQIPLLAGREFTLADAENTEPVAIVNQAFVDRYWKAQDSVGQLVQADGKSYKVVGVARNSSYNSLGHAAQPFIYLPLFQHYYHTATIHIRTTGDPMAYAAPVEQAVHELNANLPIFDLTTLQSQVGVASTGRRIAGTLVGAFGMLALTLAAIGMYGVITYKTEMRIREIGIRMALGAQKADIFRLVLGQGLWIGAVGIGFGLVVALLLTRFLRSFLFGVTATDPLSFVLTIAVLGAVAFIATAIPARRATRVVPVLALRH